MKIKNKPHPRKTKQGEAITNDDVSGSSAITNLADNVISIERSNIRITKNRDFGELVSIPFIYQPANRRLRERSNDTEIIYSWNHEGIKEPERKAINLSEFSGSITEVDKTILSFQQADVLKGF